MDVAWFFAFFCCYLFWVVPRETSVVCCCGFAGVLLNKKPQSEDCGFVVGFT
jgi:hypothetical protein